MFGPEPYHPALFQGPIWAPFSPFFPHLAGLAYGIVSSLLLTSFCFTSSGLFHDLFSLTHNRFIQTVLLLHGRRQPLLPHSDSKPDRFLPIHPFRIAFLSVAFHPASYFLGPLYTSPGEESPANRSNKPAVRC